MTDRERAEGAAGGRFSLGGRSLREHAARGTLVNGAFLVGVNALSLARGFVVAGFLTPDQYGIWGILAISLGTLLWLKEVGVEDRYVQQSEDDQEAAFQRAFTVELILTAGFVALMLAALPVLALVYGREELIGPGLVVALTVAIGALTTPLWVFYRRMQFGRQRALQSLEPVIGTAITVPLAIAGAGYWSLVAGTAAGVGAAALAAVIASPYRIRIRYDRAALRSYASFSWPLLLAALGGVAIAQGSILAARAAESVAAVGAVTLAATVSLFSDRVDHVVTATLYPAICAVSDRVELLFETFVKSNRLTLMWGVPFGVGLSLFAADLVDFGIGEEWSSAVVLLQAFGLTAAAGHIGFNWDAFYRARGDTRPMAVVSLITTATFLLVAVPLMLTSGLDGFAVGIGIMTAATLAARTWYLTRLFAGFRMARHAARALAPTVPAAGAVLLARVIESGPRGAGTAVAELALYGVVTIAATVAFERPLLREALGYLRGGTARVAA